MAIVAGYGMDSRKTITNMLSLGRMVGWYSPVCPTIVRWLPPTAFRGIVSKAASVTSNAYWRLRHETAAIVTHYTSSRLKRAKQAIFVHCGCWDRRLLYGTSRIVRIENSKTSQCEAVMVKAVKPVPFMRGALAAIASGGITC